MPIKKNILTILKWTLVAFFTLLIGLEILYVLEHKHFYISERRILLLLVLNVILLFKNRYTWLIGILLFSYSLYYITVVAVNYSYFVSLEFTSRLYILLKHNLGRGWQIFARGFPFYFYFISLFIFLSPIGRRWYGVALKNNTKYPR